MMSTFNITIPDWFAYAITVWMFIQAYPNIRQAVLDIISLF